MKVTYEEQKELGLIPESKPRFLPAKLHNSRELSNTDQNLLRACKKITCTSWSLYDSG